jgi:hypothetical protein
MNKEQLIEEAKLRGIVPGAVVESPTYGRTYTVGPTKEWHYAEDLDTWSSGDSHLYDSGNWATVISPAPQQEGLRNNSACKPDALMRAAIVAKANELGIGEFDGSSPEENPHIQFNYGTTVRPLTSRESHWHEHLTYIPPGEFYDRLCRMTPKEKPIRIDNREVVFTGGGNIKVGCTAVEWETLEAVYERAKSTR